MTMPKRERRLKRTIWFRGQNVPILYGIGRKDILGSEDWIARGTVQKIGATIFATVFLCGSVALLIASFVVRAQTSGMISGVLGQISGAVLAVLAFFLAWAGMFLAIMLFRGVVRSFGK
jgi:hypothetical protein